MIDVIHSQPATKNRVISWPTPSPQSRVHLQQFSIDNFISTCMTKNDVMQSQPATKSRIIFWPTPSPSRAPVHLEQFSIENFIPTCMTE